MINFLLSTVLAALTLHAATLEEPWKAVVAVWPPGSTIYIGESVLLQCTVRSNSTSAWSYQWYMYKAHMAVTLNPRHLVSSDSYSITMVTKDDAGIYWCKVERMEGNTTTLVLKSQSATLIVSERPPPSLTVTPSSRLMFRGERFSMQCPSSSSLTNSSTWRLKHLSSGSTERATAVGAEQCLPQGGAVTSIKTNTCSFIAASSNSGLYWCEGTKNRSNAVNITVSYDNMILKTPTLPVLVGDEVVLYCQSSRKKHNKIIFFKDGEEITGLTSVSSDKATQLRIENVTLQHEGFYKCASQDRKTESPESWLAVRPERGNFTSTDGTATSTSGFWKWIFLICGLILLCVIPLLIWVTYYHRYQLLCTRSCWPFSKESMPVVALPATKQDVTEVQWDLSWMEMSDLLDKHTYPDT